MEGYQSFRPRAATFQITGSTPASNEVARAGGPAAGEVVYMVYNRGAVDAYLAYGMTSTAARDNAVIPNAANGQQPVLPCPAGSVQAFTLAPMLFFCAVVPSGNASLMITPGEGV